MKKFTSYLFILAMLIACKDSKSSSVEKKYKHSYSGQEWEEIISKEIQKFNNELIVLYKYSNDDPEKGIVKADSLLTVNEKEKDLYRSEIKLNIKNDLDYLKAEMLYKLGRYKESLGILTKSKYKHGDYALATAANYTKLGRHEIAKSFVDSIYKGYYIYNYALGNYYETVGDRRNALRIYDTILKHKEYAHNAYYTLTRARVNELIKSRPVLMNELYFPTGDPSFEISKNDNNIRSKIFKVIHNMPECKGYKVHIYRSPTTNDEDYYWIKVAKDTPLTHDYGKYYKAKYDFFIYPKNFDIKYYDEEKKLLLSLEEWRKRMN